MFDGRLISLPPASTDPVLRLILCSRPKLVSSFSASASPSPQSLPRIEKHSTLKKEEANSHLEKPWYRLLIFNLLQFRLVGDDV